MSIIESAVRLFAPFTCLGCGVEEDTLLCVQCRQSLSPVPSRCYKCRRPTENYAMCPECRPHSALQTVAVCVEYKGLARELVHRMKYERASMAVRELAAMMTERANGLPAGAILTPIPTATGRVRKRGYDHAALLAKRVAHRADRSFMVFLRRRGQAHQMGSGKAQRLIQLEGAFRPINPNTIKGCRIVLIDDVVTTGATLEQAARVLKQYGAVRVDALVFAGA